MKFIAAFLFALAAWPAAQAQAIDSGAERARIEAERKRLEQRFKDDQKACNAKFAVTDCVNEAKARRREAMADLRRQEIALNDKERKARGAERQKEIEERSAPAKQQQADGQHRKALADQQAREERAGQKAAKKPESEGARQQRAAALESRIREKEADQARALARREQEAADNRASFEKRQKEAQAHRAQVEKRRAERKKPAASDLPPPKS